MARYVFQDAFERFIKALDDALLLDAEAGRVNYRKAKQRGSAGGNLNVESRAMYRAIAVIAVAAWEDFNEQLVCAGHEYLMRTAARPVPAELGQWFPAAKLQAPSSANVRKLYWAYFGLDPMPSWWFSFAARAREIGIDADWWVAFNDQAHLEERTRRGPDAAKWLDSLVRLRHATAHQDRKHFRQAPEIGVATHNRGKWGVTRYTGQNAIAVITQLALCTVQALSQHLSCPGQLSYLSPRRSWRLAGSPLNDLPQWPSSTGAS
ncbi:hypothetical protein KBX50_26245 [Micromonospora sp. C51]|uniref:hypothetical protein n=1 Tax=Micromonospora sp. C51 TaxID=2824879 RepID=UPI001B37ACB7|nr:hypothetical protein [Micromonospora sp. C51]MBQ1051946.1 hypothetical protein [Micromonospora sp. C51]